MKIALDWTPNVMHTGLFVAKSKGWLDLQFISPAVDEYTVMPSDKVISNLVDFSIGPPESLISHHLESEHPQLLAIAPILSRNTSAIAALREKKIDTVAKWAGKTYASLGIPFEQQMILEIARQYSDDMHVHVTSPMKLNTWTMLLNGETDLTWIFLPVEGAEAAYKGVELNLFKLEDAGIPYPACPLIKTSRNLAEADPQAIESFLKEAKRGYEYAVDYPEEAVNILRRNSENNFTEDPRLLLHCQKEINSHFLDSHKQWGKLSEQAIQNYSNWLYDKNIINRPLSAEHMCYQRAALKV
ncbi:ABC transporter substrate-binding protein [Rhodocytophaga aerolata]|uniref:Thiamine pyrimidine synthase n=1 Tax=Rhodocytophaga aerolata TaxID=455078 RepID=A0ABT8QY18_9BACT|nr:ABC transporter substrate-binding protein [Rhodocytophaga aerolata]MDO1444738.1 ABC transporter substrate-binding protein [Rhodocytophaga aerolata]